MVLLIHFGRTTLLKHRSMNSMKLHKFEHRKAKNISGCAKLNINQKCLTVDYLPLKIQTTFQFLNSDTAPIQKFNLISESAEQ